MTEITLRIILYGLIAFAPDVCTGKMRALLIDARTPPVASDGCPIHRHAAAIFFDPLQCKDPCRLDQGLCRCDLDQQLVDIGRIEARPANNDQCYNKLFCRDTCYCCASVLPGQHNIRYSRVVSFAGQEDFDAYVTRLRDLGWDRPQWRLAEDCDRHCPVQPQETDLVKYPEKPICKLLAAQVNFKPARFEVCHLSDPEREHGHYEAKDGGGRARFDFQPSETFNMRIHRQSVAEVVMFEAKIKVEDSSKVRLELATFDGNDKHPIELRTYREEEGAEIYADLVVANYIDEVDPDHGYARCTQHGVARDFELFQDLIRSPAYVHNRAIPRFHDQVGKYGKVGYQGEGDGTCGSPIYGTFEKTILRGGRDKPICPQATIE